MKAIKKLKPLLGIILILGIAIFVDMKFDSILTFGEPNNDWELASKLIRYQTIFLVIGYLTFLLIDYLLIKQEGTSQLSNLLLIVINGAIIIAGTLKMHGNFPFFRDELSIYFNTYFASYFGLTLHVTAIMIALGIGRLIQSRLRIKPKYITK